LHGSQIVVQLVDEWLAGREVELHDLCRAEPVEMFDQRSQRVAVRGYEHGRACAQIGNDSSRTTTEHALEYSSSIDGRRSRESRAAVPFVVTQLRVPRDRRIESAGGTSYGAAHT